MCYVRTRGRGRETRGVKKGKKKKKDRKASRKTQNSSDNHDLPQYFYLVPETMSASSARKHHPAQLLVHIPVPPLWNIPEPIPALTHIPPASPGEHSLTSAAPLPEISREKEGTGQGALPECSEGLLPSKTATGNSRASLCNVGTHMSGIACPKRFVILLLLP